MERIIARSRIGYWTLWNVEGVNVLNARDVDGSTVSIVVPQDSVADMTGDHDKAHETVRNLVAGGVRLPETLPTPLVGSMGNEPDPYEYRADVRERETQTRLAA